MKDYMCLLVAPAIYWTLGLPWLLAGAPHRAWRLAPLLGCALAGWIGELSLVLGLPPISTLWTIIAVSGTTLLALILPWRGEVRQGQRLRLLATFREGFLLYALALVPTVISPFPVLGEWSGDWWICYQQGQAILTGNFSAGLLQRPPLFGAAALPLWGFNGGLASFQIMTAVSSAGLLSAVLHAIEYFRGAVRLLVLAPLFFSAFFLHHTAACWSKPLAAGLLLTALVECWESRVSGRSISWWRGSIWFALAVATHQSSIIYLPLLLLVGAAKARWNDTWRLLGITTLCGLIIVAPFELWSIAHFGIAAKVAANPTVSDRAESGMGFGGNASLSLLTGFVGWSPLVALSRWANSSQPFVRMTVIRESWWLVTTYLTMLAGTLLGALIPFLVFVRKGWSELAGHPFTLRVKSSWLFLALTIIFFANAALSPFWSASGTAQNGLVGLTLILFVAFLLVIDDAPKVLPRVSVLTAIIGGIPLLALNLFICAGLSSSARFRELFTFGSEGDWTDRILQFHLQPLGLLHFPLLQLLVVCVAAGMILLYLPRRQS
jgi:hypothetical protein